MVLAEERWRHIPDEHDHMAGLATEVRDIVEAPDLVTADAAYPNRECCYRRPAPRRIFLKVVVRYLQVPPQGTWAGEVRTAYPTKRISRREPTLWP